MFDYIHCTPNKIDDIPLNCEIKHNIELDKARHILILRTQLRILLLTILHHMFQKKLVCRQLLK
jgi:hypothetical protein